MTPKEKEESGFYLAIEIEEYDDLLEEEQETRPGYFNGEWYCSDIIDYDDVVRENEAWEEDRFNFPDMEFPTKERTARSRRRKERAKHIARRRELYKDVVGMDYGKYYPVGQLASSKGKVFEDAPGWEHFEEAYSARKRNERTMEAEKDFVSARETEEELPSPWEYTAHIEKVWGEDYLEFHERLEALECEEYSKLDEVAKGNITAEELYEYYSEMETEYFNCRPIYDLYNYGKLCLRRDFGVKDYKLLRERGEDRINEAYFSYTADKGVYVAVEFGRAREICRLNGDKKGEKVFDELIEELAAKMKEREDRRVDERIEEYERVRERRAEGR